MKTIIQLVTGVSTVFLFSCYGQHDYMIYTPNKARIENRIGQSISLNVCSQYTSFSSQKSVGQKITIPADLLSEVDLAWDSKHEIKYDQNGGFDYQYSGRINYIHFTLQYSSFDRVKLCLSESGGRDIIVQKFDSCPFGTSEQYAPSSCY